MLVQSKLNLTLLIVGASSYSYTSAADIHNDARLLYNRDRDNKDDPHQSEEKLMRVGHHKRQARSKSGKGRSKGSKGSYSKGSKSRSKGSIFKDDSNRSADFPREGNEFQPARKGDIRSPCPAINTLANHGFINRDGREIDVVDLANSLEDVYRVSATMLTEEGPIASAIALNLTETRGDKNVLTIDQLFQNRDSITARNIDRDIGTEAQEHDSSFFREDSDLLQDRNPSARLAHKFFEANDGLRLDPMEVMKYQRMRIKESCDRHEEDHPETTREYTGTQRGGMARQGALLFVLGQAQIGSGFDRVSSNLRTIVADEMLPDGYDPDGDVLLTFADGCESDDLRDAFRVNVDRAICDFCPDDDAFSCEGLEKVPIIKYPLNGEC